MERRQQQRVPVCYLSTFSIEKKTVRNAVVLDLSVGGCRVHSTALVDPGTEVDLQIGLPNQPVPFIVTRALIRWAGQREFGVSFMSVRPGDHEPLLELIRSPYPFFAPLS